MTHDPWRVLQVTHPRAVIEGGCAGTIDLDLGVGQFLPNESYTRRWPWHDKLGSDFVIDCEPVDRRGPGELKQCLLSMSSRLSKAEPVARIGI